MPFPKLTRPRSAPLAPFHADASLNLALIPKLAQSLTASGVTGAFVCGSTGEGNSLSAAKRRAVAEAWRAAAGPDLRILVHVGHTSLPECRALAAHAQEIGADGIGCM